MSQAGIKSLQKQKKEANLKLEIDLMWKNKIVEGILRLFRGLHNVQDVSQLPSQFAFSMLLNMVMPHPA
jgi:hypothetical protein